MIEIKGRNLLMMATALLAWLALILQLFVLVDNSPGNGLTTCQAVGRFFIFFTTLTNLLVAVCASVLLFANRSAAGLFFARASNITAIALYIFIVGLVYNILLRNEWHPEGLQKIADELLHVAVPVAFIIYWVLFAAKSPLRWINAVQWLIYPAIYLAYAMIRGRIEGFYPYPFLDANKSTIGNIILNCAGLLLVFITAGLLFIAAGKKMNHQHK